MNRDLEKEYLEMARLRRVKKLENSLSTLRKILSDLEETAKTSELHFNYFSELVNDLNAALNKLETTKNKT